MNSPFAFGKENVEKAVEFLRFAVQEKHKICVIVDADADGFTSAAIILNYMYNLYHWAGNNSTDQCKEKLTYTIGKGSKKSATTNKNGKISIKFNTKGTHTIKVMFAGNKNYKAVSKTFTIKVV